MFLLNKDNLHAFLFNLITNGKQHVILSVKKE
jgi:hypothetical protein